MMIQKNQCLKADETTEVRISNSLCDMILNEKLSLQPSP